MFKKKVLHFVIEVSDVSIVTDLIFFALVNFFEFPVVVIVVIVDIENLVLDNFLVYVDSSRYELFSLFSHQRLRPKLIDF